LDDFAPVLDVSLDLRMKLLGRAAGRRKTHRQRATAPLRSASAPHGFVVNALDGPTGSAPNKRELNYAPSRMQASARSYHLAPMMDRAADGSITSSHPVRWTALVEEQNGRALYFSAFAAQFDNGSRPERVLGKGPQLRAAMLRWVQINRGGSYRHGNNIS